MRTFTRRHLLAAAVALAVGCSSAPTPERVEFERRRWAARRALRFDVGVFDVGAFS